MPGNLALASLWQCGDIQTETLSGSVFKKAKECLRRVCSGSDMTSSLGVSVCRVTPVDPPKLATVLCTADYEVHPTSNSQQNVKSWEIIINSSNIHTFSPVSSHLHTEIQILQILQVPHGRHREGLEDVSPEVETLQIPLQAQEGVL